MSNWLLSHGLVIVGFLLAVIAIAHMLTQRRSPQSSVAWLLVIVVAPWVGVPLYVLFGGRKLAAMARSKADLCLNSDVTLPPGDDEIDRLLRSYGVPPATSGNSFTLNADGVAGYDSLIDVIDSASKSVHYTTYILAEDEVGTEVVKRLAEKAAAGVDVRLLLDEVGSRRISRNFLAPLREAGGQVAFFMPVLHNPFHGSSNLRNHRKMTIADNRRVWSGGCNTQNEYIGPEPKADRWRDLSFVLEGPSARPFSEIFASDWAFATGEAIEVGAVAAPPDADQLVQVIPSGPDVDGDPYYAALLSAFFLAEKRIWLVTPYYVPPDSVTQALCLAARRGVDVRLIMPRVSNHRIADWARGPQLREIQQAGGKIVLFPKGMLHAKAGVIDDRHALVGTANLDDRSLFLNYEVMALLYGGDGFAALETWIADIMAQSEEGLAQPGRTREMLEAVARLMSPLI